MSIADKIFKDTCSKIIENEDIKYESRAVWPDTGEKAYTIKTFGVINRYNLQDEFPAITLRETNIKLAFDELLWIWQIKSNNIRSLHSKIWDQWADSKGFIGKAYGYQMSQQYLHHKFTHDDIQSQTDFFYPSYNIKTVNGVKWVSLDQVDGILWDLKNNPFSRRMVTNIYNHKDLHEMNLYPCAYSMTFNCSKVPNSNKLLLNGILNQRSQDMLVANNWNVCQYALLLMMIAQCCDMIPGELIHVISDCHIYDRHIPLIKELISRNEYDAPHVYLSPYRNDFYSFGTCDLFIEQYRTGAQIKKIPVAV